MTRSLPVLRTNFNGLWSSHVLRGASGIVWNRSAIPSPEGCQAQRQAAGESRPGSGITAVWHGAGLRRSALPARRCAAEAPAAVVLPPSLGLYRCAAGTARRPPPETRKTLLRINFGSVVHRAKSAAARWAAPATVVHHSHAEPPGIQQTLFAREDPCSSRRPKRSARQR